MAVRWIFDVGAHTGEDSDFYLRKGFSVVAIEAHPGHCEALRRRFAAEAAAGRFVLEPCAVGPEDGDATLFVHPKKGDWHTSYPEARRGSFERISVRCRRYATIARRHPRPYYLKIDIEGSERHVIDGLEPDTLPDYLSIEDNPDWPYLVARLLKLGFGEMQVLEQHYKDRPRPPCPTREGRYVDMAFTGHHSGPFGRDLSPEWIRLDGIEAAASIIQRLSYDGGAWHDLHFRHAGA